MIKIFNVENSENFYFVEQLACTFLLIQLHHPQIYYEDTVKIVGASLLKAIDYMFAKLLNKEKYKEAERQKKLRKNYEDILEHLMQIMEGNQENLRSYWKKVDEYIEIYGQNQEFSKCYILLKKLFE